VNHVLHTIFFALANGTISERKAGILTYIAQTILHTHRAMQQHALAEGKLHPRPIIVDIPSAVTRRAQMQAEQDAADAENDDPPSPRPKKARAPRRCKPRKSSKPASPPASATDAAPAPTEAAPPSLPLAPHNADLNHFSPRDPTLAVGLQEPDRLSPPPLPREELERPNARFNHVRGFRSFVKRRFFP
jgi:hypothetical protein